MAQAGGGRRGGQGPFLSKVDLSTKGVPVRRDDDTGSGLEAASSEPVPSSVQVRLWIALGQRLEQSLSVSGSLKTYLPSPGHHEHWNPSSSHGCTKRLDSGDGLQLTRGHDKGASTPDEGGHAFYIDLHSTCRCQQNPEPPADHHQTNDATNPGFGDGAGVDRQDGDQHEQDDAKQATADRHEVADGREIRLPGLYAGRLGHVVKI